MTYLLDTDCLIDYLSGYPPAHQALTPLFAAGIAISIITYSEIYEGIYTVRNPQEAEQGFLTFLKGIEVVGISQAVAKTNAKIRGNLRSRCKMIDHRALDLLNASIAITHNLTLISNNVRDYEDIPNLMFSSPPNLKTA